MGDDLALLRAIAADPNNDLPRLVYADWLDEHGDPLHAELIRVQCELAGKTCKGERRKLLAARVKELLAEPKFSLGDGRRVGYHRGLIDSCILSFHGKKAVLEIPPVSVWSGTPQPARVLTLDKTDSDFFKLTADVALNLGALLRGNLDTVSGWLSRVTSLVCHDTDVEPADLLRLAACPYLGGVSGIVFSDASGVPLGAIEALLTAPVIPGIRHLHLDGEDWFGDDPDDPFTTPDDPRLAAFLARFGASPRAGYLAHFHLGYLVGDRAAQALLDSPYLQPNEQLCLFSRGGLGASARRSLKKRFGEALIIETP